MSLPQASVPSRRHPDQLAYPATKAGYLEAYREALLRWMQPAFIDDALRRMRITIFSRRKLACVHDRFGRYAWNRCELDGPPQASRLRRLPD